MDNRMTRKQAFSSAETVISVKDITKSFRIYYDKGHNIKERVLYRGRGKHERREVLRGSAST